MQRDICGDSTDLVYGAYIQAEFCSPYISWNLVIALQAVYTTVMWKCETSSAENGGASAVGSILNPAGIHLKLKMFIVIVYWEKKLM